LFFRIFFAFFFLRIYNKFIKFFEDLANISINLILFSLKTNGQHSSINIEPTSRLSFKYQGLTRKFSELF
jgi:hypothetical protein